MREPVYTLPRRPLPKIQAGRGPSHPWCVLALLSEPGEAVRLEARLQPARRPPRLKPGLQPDTVGRRRSAGRVLVKAQHLWQVDFQAVSAADHLDAGRTQVDEAN